MRPMLITAVLGLAVLMAAPEVSAFGMGGGRPFHFIAGGPGGPGGPPGMPLRLLLSQMTLAQRRQARAILVADRDERRATAEALREAHEALADEVADALTLDDEPADSSTESTCVWGDPLLGVGCDEPAVMQIAWR